MSSYGESKAMDLASEKGALWVKQNLWQLSRIYPAGRRTDSSNYNPLPVWKCGCQIGEPKHPCQIHPISNNLSPPKPSDTATHKL